MTHPNYSREQLQSKKLWELKAIASQLGVEAQDKRKLESWINAIVEAQPQLIAQAELNIYIDQQAQDIARLENNQQGYKDAVAGIPEQSNDPCYRVGYDRGLRDVTPQIQNVSSQIIEFEEIGENIYGKIWKAVVNGVEIRIIPVNGGYNSNLTGDQLLISFGIAVNETLLAVAEIQAQETKPEMEVYTTATPGVYAVYSYKKDSFNRYEVNLSTETCTCPHHKHRHEQEGFKDKHIDYVKTTLLIRTTPLIREEEMLLNKPCDELTGADWERLASYNPPLLLLAAA